MSVITVVLNGAQYLEQCLRSVLEQKGVAVEHIVIDGGSTDGSLAILERYTSSLASWISEPDRGISDAMNKGIRKARGEWLLFLQSDDYLAEGDVLARALARLKPEDRLGCFAIDILNSGGATTRQQPRGFVWWLNLKITFTHQGTLFHRTLFERFGLYDEAFRIDMDYEFYMRLYRAGVEAAVHPDLRLSVMRGTGMSSQEDWPSLARRYREERAVHLRHAPSAACSLAYRVYWPVYLLYRRTWALLAQ